MHAYQPRTLNIFYLPPPISEIRYCLKLLAEPTRPDLGVGYSKRYHCYVGAWQTNAWFVRSSLPTDETEALETHGRAMFVWQRRHWHLEDSKAILWMDEDPVVEGVRIDIPDVVPNRTKGVAQFLWHELVEVLNMGVFNIAPGAISWEGSRFRAAYPERNQTIEGELSVNPAGFASQMKLRYSGKQASAVHYLVRYAYETNLALAYLPSRIHISRLRGDAEGREVGDITIFSIKAGTGPLPEDAFDAKRIAAANHFGFQFYTNGALRELNERNELVLAKVRIQKGRPTAANPYGFYASVTLASALFFVLVVRANRNERKKSQQRRAL